MAEPRQCSGTKTSNEKKALEERTKSTGVSYREKVFRLYFFMKQKTLTIIERSMDHVLVFQFDA